MEGWRPGTLVHHQVQPFRLMKLRFSIFALIGLALFSVLFVLTCVFPTNGKFDFNLRMSELSCLRQGVDPFAVWHEDVILPPYRSNLPKNPVPSGCTEQVNAYVPWAYTLMLPFSYMERGSAWMVYCVLTGIALGSLFGVAYRWGEGADARSDHVLQASVPLLAVSYLLWSNTAVGNFATFVLTASVLMAWCLSRGYDAAAGFFWAIGMVKPQSAILFAIPLLIRGRLKTCVVAATACVGATLVPMHMCGSSFVDMLKAGPAANAELFLGCGTYPRFLLRTADRGMEIVIALVIGTIICFVLTWLLRKERDWIVLFMPAAVCGASWTYTQAYSHAMSWFLAFAITRELLHNSRSKFLWVLCVLSVLSLSRWFLAWHGLCAFAGWRFPMSEYAFRCVDSLNSTLSILLAMAFCVWKVAPRSCPFQLKSTS